MTLQLLAENIKVNTIENHVVIAGGTLVCGRDKDKAMGVNRAAGSAGGSCRGWFSTPHRRGFRIMAQKVAGNILRSRHPRVIFGVVPMFRISQPSWYKFDTVRDIKEKLCYLPTLAGVTTSDDEYELPDGTTVALNEKCRSQAAEVGPGSLRRIVRHSYRVQPQHALPVRC